MKAPELREINVTQIQPSGTNPRRDFDSPTTQHYLQELADTIRRHGVLQPALVRPAYCVNTRTHAEIEARRAQVSGWTFVLVAGECRWRASMLAWREQLPCVVREMTDDDAREAQQIENLQRKDLSPLEEAQGYEDMLSLRNDDGSPRYTVASLAERIGRSVDYVFRRRRLLLLPEVAREALRSGKIDTEIARVIVTLPAVEARERLTQKIVKPDLALGPLRYDEAVRLRNEQFAQPLRGAPFALTDGELVPAAGTCVACPKMSSNMRDDHETGSAEGQKRICMDPACYRAKLAALFARQDAAAAAAGKKVLTVEESAEVYPALLAAGMMAPTSPYVELSRPPAAHLIKKEVALSSSCNWGRLVEEAERKTGTRLPRVMARDQAHVLHEVVELKHAIALVEKSGEPIFRGGEAAEGGELLDKAKVDRRAQKEEAAAERAATHDALARLYAALGSGEEFDHEKYHDALMDIAVEHAGPDGLGVIAAWRGVPESEIIAHLNHLDAAARQAMVPLLLIAPSMRVNGVRAAGYVALAEVFGLNMALPVKKKRVPKKAPAPKLTAEQIEARVRELRRQRKTETDIFLALNVPKRTVRALLKKIAAEEKAAA